MDRSISSLTTLPSPLNCVPADSKSSRPRPGIVYSRSMSSGRFACVEQCHVICELRNGDATRAIKREAEPIDVAKAIYFLVSPDADFVTGQILAADGGAVYH